MSRRALVMTPEVRLRDRVVDALRAAGLEVRAAGPGEDVATAFAAFRPDVVVASADPNGIAAWRAVRARHRNAAPDLVWVASRTGATEPETPSRYGPDAAEVLDPSDLERLVLRAGGSSPPPPPAPSALPMAPSLALAEPEPPPLDLGPSVAELVTDEVEPEPPGAILLGPGLASSPLHARATVGLSGPVEAATLEAAPAADARGATRPEHPAPIESPRPDHDDARARGPEPGDDDDGPTRLGEAAAPTPTEAGPPADAPGDAPSDPTSDPTSDAAAGVVSDAPPGEAAAVVSSEADPAVARVEAATLEAARAALEESFQLYERRLAEVLAAERARSSAPPAAAPRGADRAPVLPTARPPLAHGGPERGGSGLERPADPTGRPARAGGAPAPSAPATAIASPPARRRRPATRPPVRGAGRPATRPSTRPSTRPTTSRSDAPPPTPTTPTTPRTEDDEASSD